LERPQQAGEPRHRPEPISKGIDHEVPPVALEDHPAAGVDERTRPEHEAQEEVGIQIEELSRRYEASIRKVTMRFGSRALWSPPPWKDSNPATMVSA